MRTYTCYICKKMASPSPNRFCPDCIESRRAEADSNLITDHIEFAVGSLYRSIDSLSNHCKASGEPFGLMMEGAIEAGLKGGRSSDDRKKKLKDLIALLSEVYDSLE